MAMGFYTQTSTFKKTPYPPYFWFCHSCPRSSSMAASSSSSSSSCRSFWTSSHKPMYRRRAHSLHSTKEQFLNVNIVCRSLRFNVSSNYGTMSLNEIPAYADAAQWSLKTDGYSYARMVPFDRKQVVPRNPWSTDKLNAAPESVQIDSYLPGTPAGWKQHTKELAEQKTPRSACNNHIAVLAAIQQVNTIIREQDNHEALQDGSGYENELIPEVEDVVGEGVSRNLSSSPYRVNGPTNSQIARPPHNSCRQQQKYDAKYENNQQNNPGNKHVSSTDISSKGFQPNGLSSRNSFKQRNAADEKSAANADAANEAYTVPINPKESQSLDHTYLRKRLDRIYNKVFVVENISVAKCIVEKLTNQYRHLVHACDTEVAKIDVKQETPVDHGEIICFSIYSGAEADFGNGKSCIWVDVLDGGGKSILAEFAPFFEDPSIKKVWHNYSFDNHVIENYGLKVFGFHADTMHMARLWDSSRRMAGGYSLEALTGDSHGIMFGAKLGPNEELIGKTSMKTIFGRKKLKKDGSEGKVINIPPVEELQRVEREPWVCYSALDSISTLKLYERLKSKLSSRVWKLNGVEKGTMFDFYEQYWRPFGELLVKMETEGMLVDRAYLAEIEEVAKAEQQVAADRFRNWASKHCSDAKYMNVGSDAQLRQLFFGGIINSKDPNEFLLVEKEFKVPNVDKVIEEGKKTPTKFCKIKLHSICNNLKTEMYTASGWPSVSGDALKTLAGKVSVDYDFTEDEKVDDIPYGEPSETTPTDNSDTVYGTAYAAFGKGSKGREACHAIAALCQVCSIDSLISNFILPLQGSHIKGNKNGRIHCSLNINTETGRLSARRPNLQNQPALEKDRYKIRQAFIAAPGNSLIVADYGQLELRILAHLAGCKSMLDAFKAGGDFHSRTAMNMYPYIRDAVDKRQVLLEWHPQPGEDHPPVPLLKDTFASERRKAKMLNFSIAYGKTAVGLARDWKVSVKEAKETVARWYSDREEVLEWQEARKKEARQIRCVHTLLGRARSFPYTENATPSQKGHIERAAINTPVQGSAADVAMCAMLEISKNVRLKEVGWRLLLQVHDEVILEGPTESAVAAKAIVVECMSKPFDGKNILDVDLSVDAKCAQNWYSAK